MRYLHTSGLTQTLQETSLPVMTAKRNSLLEIYSMNVNDAVENCVVNATLSMNPNFQTMMPSTYMQMQYAAGMERKQLNFVRLR